LSGAALVALGIMFLLDRMLIVPGWVLSAWFPLFLIVFGVARILWPSRPGRQVGGMWIALVGGLLLLEHLDIVELRESWPAFVILAGLILVFRALGWLPGRRAWRGPRRWKEVGR
jgi:FtsH-binding integral membrane protein